MDKSYARLIVVALLCLAVFIIVQVQRAKTGVELASTYDLPQQITQWKGHDIGSGNEQWMNELGANRMVFRTYNKDDTIISLYLAYYTDLNSSDLVHSPTVCYPGQGWEVVSDSVEVFPLGTSEFRANRLIIQKKGQTQIVYAWWQTPERILATNSGHRLYQLLSTLVLTQSASVWVRLSLDATPENEKEQEGHLQEFIHQVVPFVGNYFRAE